MQINLYVGGKQLENYLKDFADGHELMYRLTDPAVFEPFRRYTGTIYKKYSYALYMENLVFVNIDKYIKKFAQLSTNKKIASLIKYINRNEPEHILLYTNKINIEHLKIFYHYYHEQIIIKYCNDIDIYPLRDFNVIFERVNEDGTAC